VRVQGLWRGVRMHGLWRGVRVQGLWRSVRVHGLWRSVRVHGLWRSVRVHGLWRSVRMARPPLFKGMKRGSMCVRVASCRDARMRRGLHLQGAWGVCLNVCHDFWACAALPDLAVWGAGLPDLKLYEVQDNLGSDPGPHTLQWGRAVPLSQQLLLEGCFDSAMLDVGELETG